MQDSELSALVRRARDGSQDAYESLVREFSPALYGYLMRSVRNRSDAEELLQEVFLRMVRGLKRYRGQKRFGVWLFRVAHNLVVDHWRKHQPIPVAVGEDGGADVGILGQSDDDPAGRMEAHEQQDRLQDALAQLPPEQRETLMLRYFSDMSFKEIAEVTENPLGTVLARAHRGVARLRALLKEGN